MAELTKEEFTERFIAHMVKHVGFASFDDGTPVREYAECVVSSYFDDPEQRADGPEACAELDMDYWGEG